jgi:hypothetical protein
VRRASSFRRTVAMLNLLKEWQEGAQFNYVLNRSHMIALVFINPNVQCTKTTQVEVNVLRNGTINSKQCTPYG